MHGNMHFLVTVMILDYSKALSLQGIREFLEQMSRDLTQVQTEKGKFFNIH